MSNARTTLLDEADRYLQSQIRDDAPPTEWTAPLVEARLIEAFEILPSASSRIGPKEFGSNWPAILREFSDLVDAQSFAEQQKEVTKVRPRPSVDQISRMEEALGWPAQFLADDQKMADALNVWAYCKASGADLKHILQTRAKKAADLAGKLQTAENEYLEAARAALAQEVATWANARRFLSTGTDEHLDRIRSNAHIRMARAVEHLKPVMIRPSDAMPDKVISRTSCDQYRFMASHLIATKLNRAMVTVR